MWSSIDKRKFPVERGSAVTELVICMLPYAMVLFGVILLGQLALGKQEIYKSVAWAAAKPNAQGMSGGVDKHFFPGSFADTAGIKDNPDYSPSADAATEEPVLPYQGVDLEACLKRSSLRISHTTRIENGEVLVDVNVSATTAGRALQNSGVVDTSGAIGSQTVTPADLATLTFNVSVDSFIAAEMADTLGGWLNYSKADASYKFKLENTSPMPGEEEDGGLRKEYAVGDITVDSEFYSLQTASPSSAGFRGYLARDTVDMDAFLDIGFESADGLMPMVDPLKLDTNVAPVLADDLQHLWDKAYTP